MKAISCLDLGPRSFKYQNKIMVFSEITGFGNYCSLRPETLQMQTTYEVNKGV